MKRMFLFAGRNAKEILRDPLSYIFCLGFPVVMLIIMSIVNTSIPPEAGMDIFRIDKLSAGVSVFGLLFTMLFAALQVSKDRGGSFLIRLYASPMRASDFIGGYYLTCILIAIVQTAICMIASFIIGCITGVELNIINLIVAVPVMIIPSAMFIGFGVLFGSLFSDKAAPGLCSIIISLGSMLGGVFMDVEGMGGVIYDISNVLPFYHCVKAGRAAVSGSFGDIGIPLLIALAYTVVITLISAIAFSRKMKADLN